MIAQRIKYLRESRGLTQKKVADAVHVTASAISQYENGVSRPCRENLALLAGFFHVTVAYLEGTSSVEDLENLMNENYVDGVTVRNLIDKCLCISQSDRKNIYRIIDLMAKDYSDEG